MIATDTIVPTTTISKKIYISIPYTGRESVSFKLTNQVAGEIIRNGDIPLSPISHSHAIEEECDEKWGWEVWQKIDYSFIDWADEVLVVNFDDEAINTSEGVQDEIKYAEKTGKPVKYLKVDYTFNLKNIK